MPYEFYLNPRMIKAGSIESSMLDKTTQTKLKDLGQKEVTYSELKSLRDDSLLVPGQKYRITDYVCSGIGQNMSVINHSFDIIVEALAKNKLSENAKAAQRSNDIGSLINSKLFEYTDINGWKSLDIDSNTPQPILNIVGVSTDGKVAYDRTKHSGLNPGNVIKVSFTGFVGDYNNTSAQKPITGLGVVLANQDDTEILAYDYGYGKEAYYITMPDNVTSNTSYYIKFYADGSNVDAINGICGTKAEVYSGTPYFKNNDLNKWDLKYSLDRDGFNWPSLDNNVFKGVIYYMKDDFNNEAPYDFKNILFPVTTNGSSNYYYTFSYVMDGSVYDATVITNKCFENTIKGDYDIDGVQKLNKIVFINEDFGGNTNCSFNSFDGYCNNMVFGHACCSNTFGCYCTNNSFGRECSFNTFGDYFGLYGGGNSFGNYCQSNTFGVNCDKNTFGNYILRTTFGNKCTNCKFTNAASNGSLLEACKCITIGDECNNLNLYNTEVPSYSSGKFLQNIEVNPGLTGNVKISGLNKGYKQAVAKDSNGQTVIFIDGENSYELPPASESVLGGVKIGTGFICDSGQLSLDTASGTHLGGVMIGTGFICGTDSGLLSLDTATFDTIGGVIIGTGFNYNKFNGELNLGSATRSTIGGVIVGEGIAVDDNGTISIPNKNIVYVNLKTSEKYFSSLSSSQVNSLDLTANYIIANSSGFNNSNIYLDASILDKYSKPNQYTECKILWDNTGGVNLEIGTMGLYSKFMNDSLLSSRAADVANDMVSSNISIPQAITKANTTGSKIEITIRSYGQVSKSSKTYSNYPNYGSADYIMGTGIAHKHYITWQKV